MTGRWIEFADVRCVTVDAREASILVDREELFAQVLSQTIFVMTLGTGSDRHIRFQPTQRRGLRDIDMARRAFRDVLFLLAAAVVDKLRRDPFRRFFRSVGRGQFVTAVAVVGDRLLRLPVTVETRAVPGWRRLEHRGALPMTDGAVVVTLRRMRESQQRDHVLVPVVRKLDRKLELHRWISKRQSRLITRRRLRVTHGTNGRPRAAEELRAMTTHARIMARVIVDIRKLDLVTRIARGLMLVGRV